MRTTITLDPDIAARLKRLSRERGISFKEAVNSSLRAGLEPTGDRVSPDRYVLPTYSMRVRPGIDLDRARLLDAAIEDDEIMRKVALRK
jgi:hypothetical protein